MKQGSYESQNDKTHNLVILGLTLENTRTKFNSYYKQGNMSMHPSSLKIFILQRIKFLIL